MNLVIIVTMNYKYSSLCVSTCARSGAHNGKERPTSVPISRKVAAHDTPYTDPFAVCVRVRLHKIDVK